MEEKIMRQRFYKHKYFYNMLIKFLLPVLLSITVVGGVGTAVGYSYLKAELDQTNQKLLQSRSEERRVGERVCQYV